MTTAVEPNPNVKAWHLSSFYREAVESAVNYNSQLVQDRCSRLPYLDAQTGIAQVTSPLLRSRLERRRGLAPGQLFSYPPRRWRRETKPNPLLKKEASSEVLSQQQTSSPGVATAAAGLIQTVEGKRSSRLATISRAKDSTDGFLAPVAGVRPSLPLESPGSSELNEEEESPEPDVDYMEDYDSEEEKKQKKKKRPPPRNRGTSSNNNVAALNTRSSKNADNDKPFPCSQCNRRYKTASSLKAHRTQYHANKVSPSAPPLASGTPLTTPPPGKAEVRIPVVLPPPPNLNGKEDAKPSPYCDFCLGDSTCNRKTSKQEKMVSCANCGRSAHPSCMQFSDSLAAVVYTYRWQCIECKSCHFCGTSENDDQLLFCDDCDRGYHMYCLHPPLKNPPEGNWTCGMCFKIAI